METNSVIIITGVVAVATAVILSLFKSSRDLTVTIKMEKDEEDNDYPIKSDGVEELEVKPKRKYTKRVSKLNVIKTKPAAKKSVGRPKKAK
jgi:beta-lactam-binding protein with PASTA domain